MMAGDSTNNSETEFADAEATLLQPEASRVSPPRRSAPSRKFLRRWVAKWSRWLHIYLSMFGSAAILFFSATGLTLNHPDWFFRETSTQFSGRLNLEWLNLNSPPPENWDEYDFSHQIARLEVVEHLRTAHQLRGTVTDFLAFEDECEATFQSPGYAATARIDRRDGNYTLDVIANDLVTVMNDLHKGRHSGTSWSWVIDVSAIIGTLVGLSGFVLIFFLKLRRTAGILTAISGAVLTWYLYLVATA